MENNNTNENIDRGNVLTRITAGLNEPVKPLITNNDSDTPIVRHMTAVDEHADPAVANIRAKQARRQQTLSTISAGLVKQHQEKAEIETEALQSEDEDVTADQEIKIGVPYRTKTDEAVGSPNDIPTLTAITEGLDIADDLRYNQ